MKKKARKPSVAPGNEEFLRKSAGKDEIKKGEYTLVTRLSYDETDSS